MQTFKLNPHLGRVVSDQTSAELNAGRFVLHLNISRRTTGGISWKVAKLRQEGEVSACHREGHGVVRGGGSQGNVGGRVVPDRVNTILDA